MNGIVKYLGSVRQFGELGWDLTEGLRMLSQSGAWIVLFGHGMLEIVVVAVDDVKAAHCEIVILLLVRLGLLRIDMLTFSQNACIVLCLLSTGSSSLIELQRRRRETSCEIVTCSIWPSLKSIMASLPNSEYFSLMFLSTAAKPFSSMSERIVKRSAWRPISGKNFKRGLSSPLRRSSMASPWLSKMADLRTNIRSHPTVSFIDQLTGIFECHTLPSLDCSLVRVGWCFSEIWFGGPKVNWLESAQFKTYQIICKLPAGFDFWRLPYF